MISVIVCSLKKHPETLKCLPKNVEVIVSRSVGRSKARNEGAKKARGEILLFLDGDLHFEPKTIFEICKLIDDDHMISYPSIIVRTRVMGITKKNFERLNGFDERYEVCEDWDFGLRAKNLGLTIRYVDAKLFSHIPHQKPNRYFIHSDVGKMKLLFKHKIFVIRKVEKVSPLSAFWFFISAERKGFTNLRSLCVKIFTFYWLMIKGLISGKPILKEV